MITQCITVTVDEPATPITNAAPTPPLTLINIVADTLTDRTAVRTLSSFLLSFPPTCKQYYRSIPKDGNIVCCHGWSAQGSDKLFSLSRHTYAPTLYVNKAVWRRGVPFIAPPPSSLEGMTAFDGNLPTTARAHVWMVLLFSRLYLPPR